MISRPVVYSNVKRRLRAVAMILESVDNGKLNNIQKSIFYQSAIILLCSVVEALTYQLAWFVSLNNKHTVGATTEYKELLKIKSETLSTQYDLYVCKKNRADLSLEEADFGKFLIFLKNSGIILGHKYIQINRIRIERNKIHLQSFDKKEVGYSRSKINRISKIVVYLLDKIENQMEILAR